MQTAGGTQSFGPATGSDRRTWYRTGLALLVLLALNSRLTAAERGTTGQSRPNIVLLFVDDPLDSANIPFFVLLGLGQIAAFLGSTTLIGKEAPAEKRGAIVGAFSVFGAMGILVMSGVGGRLFDTVDPRAPFMVLGLMNLIVMGSAVYVRIRAPGDSRPKATAWKSTVKSSGKAA